MYYNVLYVCIRITNVLYMNFQCISNGLHMYSTYNVLYIFCIYICLLYVLYMYSICILYVLFMYCIYVLYIYL